MIIVNKLIRAFITILAIAIVFVHTNAIADERLNLLLSKLQQAEGSEEKINILISIGDWYEYSHPDTALLFYWKAVAEANASIEKSDERSVGYIKLKAKAIRYIGYIHQHLGDYRKALDFYFKALSIAESINDLNKIFKCYNNIGIINHLQKEYGIANEYYTKALEIAEESGNIPAMSMIFINFGNLEMDLGDLSDSIPSKHKHYFNSKQYYVEALKIKASINDTKGQSLCCNNLGNIHKKIASLQKDESTQIELLSQANTFYRQSIDHSKSINDIIGLSMVYGNLADLYVKRYELKRIKGKDKLTLMDSALFFGNRGFELAVETNSLYLQNEIAILLRNFYTLKGSTERALEFANIYIETRENLFSEEKTKALQEMRTKYETEKKEQQIEVQLLTIQKAKSKLLIVVLIASLLLLASLSLGYVIRLKTRTERLLAKKNDELKTSNATKDKFFSIISHDLRTPVSGFRNLSSAIGKNIEHLSNEQISENLYHLSQSADDTVNLLNNMLHWAKSQQNKIEVVRFPVPVARMCKRLTEELSPKLKEKGITIDIDVDESLEPEVDENIVSTVLRNLLTNAIKFSPNGSTIHLAASMNKEGVAFSVRDQGIGMTQEDQGKLFRIEYDTKSIGSSPEKGSGLGLIICKELVTLHGGRVWVESEPSKGSAFFFSLPIH